ncbi:MAG TPA: hypothetical protein VK841_19155 [Polyangiaceae bacterium]|jgi:hypothetical protein|nr:hypothetical protein [Polyangiaceae bacterium]
MAEDRKPKIDLKSRLQKMGGPAAATPPPPGMGSVPAPSMAPVRPPSMAPVPPAIQAPSMAPGVGRPASARPAAGFDPLAAAAQPFKAAPAMAAPQRIELDDGVVRQARRGGFRSGLTAGIVVGGVFLVLGWVGGNAASQGADRSKGVHDAHDLGADLLKAKDSLDQVKAKLQDGAKSLVADRKFPSSLGQDLSGMNVDFAGDKLFGRRFAGVPADTTRQLFDFITRVQALNDKKDLVVSLLAKLQKPITDELSRPAGQLPISYVVVLDKDTSNMGAFMAPLATPISPDDKAGVPNELTFLNPRGSGNVKLPRLTSDKIPATGAATTIVPNTFEKVCPSATRGQIAQLVSTINSVINEIEGQKSPEGGDVITETKAGLDEVAAKLADSLSKVN